MEEPRTSYEVIYGYMEFLEGLFLKYFPFIDSSSLYTYYIVNYYLKELENKENNKEGS